MSLLVGLIKITAFLLFLINIYHIYHFALKKQNDLGFFWMLNILNIMLFLSVFVKEFYFLSFCFLFVFFIFLVGMRK